MLLLAIDSSQEICSLALSKDSKLLYETHFEHHMSLLKRLMPNIFFVISESGYDVKDLSGIVCGLGPGSFTGSRIGITIAKTLAWSLNIPIVGISTLDVLAETLECDCSEYICPMVHARKGEVFWSFYKQNSDNRLTEYKADVIEDIAQHLKLSDEYSNCTILGSGAVRNYDLLKELLPNVRIHKSTNFTYPRGSKLLEMGEKRILANDFDNTLSITPLYVKKPTPVVRLETGEFKLKA
ncbi:MAG: tRNA (adenosine(37)-N6)-threonylcarbamoyltransferase complex dimerization subunit type 1 TsaB [Armatimonadota bacterium]